MHRPLALLLALAALLLAGCASLPAEAPRPASLAYTDVAAAELARLSTAATPDDRRHFSGFALLADPAQALDARLSLAQRAQKSLDIQYYLLAADNTGRMFLRALVDAAARGVRVRLLVDDLHTAEVQDLLRALAERPNLEVRLFNPLPVRSSALGARLLLSLHQFDRINRRMHNKLFIADNSWAVTGGRNIADEYFMRADEANFVDMDLLSSGPVVRGLSEVFDQFWNSALAYPVASLMVEPLTPEALQQQLRRLGPLPAEDGTLDTLARTLVFAPASVYADSPTKAMGSQDSAAAGSAMASTLALLQSARQQVLIASPYFIPGERGLALMREATARGLRIEVTTNSLAATDEPLAYWAYVRYRLEMLRMGISVAELSPTQGRRRGRLLGDLRSSTPRLHAKLAVVDQRWLLVGSMNMDLRSSRSNTELGLVIDSPELAAQVAHTLQHRWGPGNYRLQLAGADAAAQVQWLEDADDDGSGDGETAATSQLHSAEPHVSWLARMRLELLSMFVSEALL